MNLCNEHGPYDGVSCPYCAQQSSGRPQPPAPLWVDDEEPTAPLAGRRGSSGYDDDLEATDPRAGRRRYGGFDDDLDETEIPSRMRRRGQAWDDDDDLEQTEIPRKRGRRGNAWDDDDLDQTVVDRPAKTGLLGWLIIKEGPRRGKIHEISHGNTLGRKKAHVMIDDLKIGKQHAKIRIKDDRFEILDMMSRNGTFVNGVEIQEITALQENDEIKMGDTVFVLKTLP